MPSAAPPRPVLPAAVSVLSAAVVGGEPVAATVLGAHGPALYLDVAGRVLPVVTADAVPLPTALRLAAASGRVEWGVVAGDVVPVGDGRVVLPGLELVVSRTWRPARVRRATASTLTSRAILPALLRDECASARPDHHVRTHDGVHDGAGDDGDWLADGIRALFSGVGCRTGRSGSHLGTRPGEGGCAEAVAALVGRGQGLTPSGDDALAGALLVTHALGAAAPLATAVRARLGATTAVSAALLDAAADGFATGDVVNLVDAALVGDDATVAAVLPAVLAIGHGSGRDLVTGITVTLDALATRRVTTPAAELTPSGRSVA
ncbi:MAG TPA: DUF2877 domain-containing protein [Ornithinibacter sp.]|nr:DUF2877 domain-containing protein [Ornithinibacter sp.]